MADMPIYGKNLKKIFFSETKRPMTLKVGMQHRVLEDYKVCSNYDPELTLTLIAYAFVWKKGKAMDFSESIMVYDIKVDRRSQPNEYMKL